MKALIQRVIEGSVEVDSATVGRIAKGLVVLLGVKAGDTEADAKWLAEKTVNLRIFSDNDGKMNLSVFDIGGGILAISQFTLYGDTKKGNRPSFARAAEPVLAERLYGKYVDTLKTILGDERVATGVFGARMKVHIINDGPVTVEITNDPS